MYIMSWVGLNSDFEENHYSATTFTNPLKISCAKAQASLNSGTPQTKMFEIVPPINFACIKSS